MPPDHRQVATCHVCGATRNTDWMARVGNFDYCLPNGSVGSPGNVDHRPDKVPPTDHVPSPTTREPSNDVSMDGPNVRKAFAPEVTSWTLVPFGDYLWHLPTTLVKQIEAEAAAAPQARVRALEDWGRRWVAARDARAAMRIVIGETPSWHTLETAHALNVELDALLAAEQPTPERDGGLLEWALRQVDWEELAYLAPPAAVRGYYAWQRLDAIFDRLAAASPATPADPDQWEQP